MSQTPNPGNSADQPEFTEKNAEATSGGEAEPFSAGPVVEPDGGEPTVEPADSPSMPQPSPAYPSPSSSAPAGYDKPVQPAATEYGQPSYQQPLEQVPPASYPGQQQPGYQQPYQQQQYQQPGYGQPYGEQKSKVAAGVLGILLGGLGIHNFYLGFTKKALIQLLVSVLSLGILYVFMEIWGLIEGILILVGHESFRNDARGIPLKD